MERPCLVECNGKEDTDGAEASHRREGLSVVETIGLRESSSHETRLMASDGTIGIVLEGVHPLARDNIDVQRARNQCPSLSLKEYGIFRIHSSLPLRYLQSFKICLGN